jgi:hypothetical protein
LGTVSEWAGVPEAELYYLLDGGAYGFRVEAAGSTLGSMPFELSCGVEDIDSYLAVFSDVVVYGDEGLTQEACTLERGASASAVGSSGYQLVSDVMEDPAVYLVQLAGFSERCDGLSEGDIEVKASSVFGADNSLVPILR